MSTVSGRKEEIGKRIANARKDADLSQQELADKVDRTRQSISKYERGLQQSSYEIIEEIAAAVDVDPAWLWSGGDRLPVQESEDSSDINENGLSFDPPDSFEIQIYHDVRPSAGNGNIIHQIQELDPDTLTQSKWLFKQLIGFWPPDDMVGMYIDGESMKTVEGPYEDGQLIFYQPAEEFTSGDRFILCVEDASTGDWRLLFKRVQTYAGGGIRILSDNKDAGIEDETLLPNEEGQLIHQTTKLPVRLRAVGRVLWPDPDQRAEDVALITETIERLVNMGIINS